MAEELPPLAAQRWVFDARRNLVTNESNKGYVVASVGSGGPAADRNLNGRAIAAVPSLVKAIELGLPALRNELACNLSGHCLSDAEGRPDRASLDEDVEEVVEALEAAIAAAEQALTAIAFPSCAEIPHG
ncbi:MAG TPA: hypothetical protein VGB57_05535 [Allosphingosinicella sp.]|jgi:hypothetical protein